MAKKKTHGGSRKGAGRKPASNEGATVNVGATVPASLIDKLDDLRQKKGWNRSQAITEAIRRLVKNTRA